MRNYNSEKYLPIALLSVPKKWRSFYLASPKEVNYDYIVKRMPFEEFIEMSKRTWLFDWVFIINGKGEPVLNDVAYKEDGHLFMNRAFVSKKTVDLYNALPEAFTSEEYNKIRYSIKSPIKYKDQLMRGHFLKYECNDPVQKTLITHYWKTDFKPVARP